MLDNLIEKFLENKAKQEELKKEQDELSSQIVELVDKMPNKKYEDNGHKVSVVAKRTFKYLDKTAIMNYLKNNELDEIYIVKDISTTKFNNELKANGTLYKDVKEFIQENVTNSLTVTK